MLSIYLLGFRHKHIKRIKVIPCDIDQYYYVDIIEICYTKISVLPEELFNLTLRELEFYNNKLEVLPRKIQNLTKLSYLDISDNNLSTLPREIFNLNLACISVSGNMFTCPYNTWKSTKQTLEELKINGYID